MDACYSLLPLIILHLVALKPAGEAEAEANVRLQYWRRKTMYIRYARCTKSYF